MAKQIKTNVMRILDQKKIEYETHFYEPDGTLTGVEIAKILGEDPKQVYKTLVTIGASKAYYVFVIPVAAELDLKKAAVAVSEKNIEMVKSKDLLGLTGYIHGGCSPIGMKKEFKTTVDSTALANEEILFSAGKIGAQIHMKMVDIDKAFIHSYADVIK